MQEIRRDTLLGHTVVFAPQRSQRPHEFLPPPPAAATNCDFCEGHEAETPQELFAVRAKGTPGQSPGWSVRVVSNKYPAVAPICCVQPNETQGSVTAAGRRSAEPAYGSHEVIIESPRHLTRLSEISRLNWLDILRAYRGRYQFWKRDGRLPYVLVFKNHGARAGASLQHVHSQLLALPSVPPAVAAEGERCLAFVQRHGRGPLTVMLSEAEEEGRVVAGNDRFVAFCPFASRFAGETWIVPRQPGSPFESLRGGALDQLAGLLHAVTQALEAEWGDPALNLMLHTAPFDTFSHDHYHWRMEITPRTATVAGCEIASGVFLNSLPPETAAAALRCHLESP